MRSGHYGIDPRSHKNLVPDFRPIGHYPNNSVIRPQTSFGINLPTSRPSTAMVQRKPIKHGYPPKKIQCSPTIKEKKEPAQTRYNVHTVFDLIIDDTRNKTLHESVEFHVKKLFMAEHTFFWFVCSSESCFYSPTKKQTCEINQSILSAAYETNEVINTMKPSNHEKFSVEIDSELLPTLYIPLGDEDNHVYAVIQVFHPIGKLFLTVDLSTGISLSKKFECFSHFLFDTERFTEAANDIACSRNKNPIAYLIDQIQFHFDCRSVEFWIGDTGSSFLRYDSSVNTYVRIIGGNPGVIIRAFQNREVLNISDSSLCEEYNEEFDGDLHNSILAIPYMNDLLPSAIVLRGKNNEEPFSYTDEIELKALTPLILKCLSTTGSGSTEEFSNRLKALLEVAEILGGVLDIDTLVPTIMERACLLLNTERCSLFLVDSTRESLTTTFQSGLDESIKMPISKGIVGHTATTGDIVNISDAYQDSRFDPAVDQKTGFKSKTILTVPIYNNRGEIAGVTEMINKKDDLNFNDDDIKMMVAFNVFCGISLDNAQLYRTSLELTRQLKGFVEMSSALNKTKTLHEVIEEILTNAKNVINASRATLFMKEEDSNSLNQFVSIGENSDYGTKFAEKILQTRHFRAFTQKDIQEILNPKPQEEQKEEQKENQEEQKDNQQEKETNQPESKEDQQENKDNQPESKEDQQESKDGQSETKPDQQENKDNQSESKTDQKQGNYRLPSRLAVAFESTDPASTNLPQVQHSQTICDFPLLTSDECIFGVFEIASNSKILQEDIKLLECFVVFASVSIEKSELQKIASYGNVELEMKKYIGDNERSEVGTVPIKLDMSDSDKEKVFILNFDAPFYDGIGHFRVIWAIFDRFKLLSEYKINNETFFAFISTISSTYNKVPYHNWRHAVDVTQFATYEIVTAKLDESWTKFELFGFFVSAICHDANHDGFTNVYNEKAETPLGILFKNQSVMETHHCSVTIGVISKEECNIFHSLNPGEIKTIWNQIIKLILSTDMAKHYAILKSANELLDKGPFDMTNPEHRVTTMQLVLKCADISNVSRPFELANKWCDVLCEEFFRQGDLEMTNGMEYTSPLNDRAHLDKPKSQIGFYTYVCLPLYETTARGIPSLIVNVNQVKSNLEVWKKDMEQGANNNN
ncbi:hypothetical protein M9Y10_035190 [Tritrichomonas musculus]|uniref:PDEase domain-containing protein n=1 Tax=Tritrichomonas musculus TaxID=1915356 RepID=A0ABR2KGZ6_9EUKA